ncbi:carbohydrate ABC transporter permease [Paenibacillus alginolyticus]|jgi:multiple sugar transport system permease protein|uniref:Carbohydrate ABC transporter permease n=1 Tax=Paenibacillus alginolyticus TaxID=59839 RepID=A0ABT4G9Q6_9BACL|nr:carbohydrate ABC transporter permease [Paenibacillus alginolyticus]MCY9692905.1 carbohydrate ABC transporter permease [Paenibacillus alginolyticus]MEC0144358.1 carbohydrate ABC transporter permease [Paenibacillus alginolyticus]
MDKFKNVKKTLLTILMFIIGVLFMSPFLWMISASMKPEADVFLYPIQWIPKHWNLIENYKTVWSTKFSLYYWNSIKVSVLTTALSVLLSSMAAYAFSKIKFRGRHVLFVLVLAIYMIPSQAILVPQFLLFRWMGLFDSHFGLILLGSFSVLGTFMLRQFYMGIHEEFIESARMDGAGHVRIFFSICTPLVRPAIATYAILRFIWTWNDYQNPLIFLRTKDLFTLPLGIRSFADLNGEFYSLIMAASVSAIVPLLIIFIIGQKQVIEGISMGGVKG